MNWSYTTRQHVHHTNYIDSSLTARFSCVAIAAFASYSVILIVWDANSFVTTKRIVRLTGTLFENMTQHGFDVVVTII